MDKRTVVYMHMLETAMITVTSHESPAVYRIILRDFIHDKVETQGRILITIECTCILISVK